MMLCKPAGGHMDDQVRLSLDEAWALSVAILEQHGFSSAHAAAIARSVVAAQRDECHSHGLYRLLDCVRTVRHGGVDPCAIPEVIDQASGVVRVDARGGSSLLAFETGRKHLIDKARANGVAVLAVNNAFHFSALWPEVESLAEQGLVALAMTPSHAYVAPAGGQSPLLGTNPIAFAWPRPEGLPFTFDFATSVVARGEVELHRRAGKRLPEGWALDGEGHPTTDPAAALAGALLPFGGHKGSALSIMIELLAGPLIGDRLGHQTRPADGSGEGAPQHGEFILAMDPHAFLGADAETHLRQAEALFEGVIAQGARLPSQRRHAARKRSQTEGVTIPSELYEELVHLKDSDGA
ncbi:Ldh family oxidoreductase [Halomonas korlensis]|uniref:Malate/lactate/ureidoglycolate dehydrogenase, LDH2 family n=1 Tax=Halomonas korlensis TaxID=463301 RepID=A0A1I7HRR6_9GAMM|nr:Ldh family oxidoreductase [Halomonas korlensis]SFU63435.1 Malate/lactate/ureidoglycolate dehydrogenase, LDH2 family [Halomonas korlensis]